MTVELWMPMGFERPETIAACARRAEADGWDGLKVYDTQCLFGDAFVMTTAAALATDRLQLSLSTSNPVTRHPAVAASAMASIAAIAGARVHYGIGRGDSALAYVGGAPASVSTFERYITAVRAYLHGEPVAFQSIAPWRLTDDVTRLRLAHAPSESSLRWLDTSAPPVPIEVYATGPRVLDVAGRLADRVALGLGGDTERLRWAIDVARSARARAGLDPDTLSFSAVVPTGVADDVDRARRSVANMVASAARFAVLAGTVVGPVTDEQRRVYEAIGATYDMDRHGELGEQVNALTNAFIETYAIVGPAERCVERIGEIAALGIDAIMLAPPQGDADDDDIRDGYRLLVDDVLPAVRRTSEEEELADDGVRHDDGAGRWRRPPLS
jgi:5,10-methylenetetrahydromethanopterin reductase